MQERARSIVAEGYTATKWFFRHGSGAGREGMAKNLELVRVLRESVGEDVDIMFDAWNSWDVPYAIAMGEQMAEYHPRWLEEPAPPDRIELRRHPPGDQFSRRRRRARVHSLGSQGLNRGRRSGRAAA